MPNTTSPKICVVERCERRAHARGLCTLHYQRWSRSGDPGEAESRVSRSATGLCTVEGCERRHYSLGYCQLHYQRIKRMGDLGPVGLMPKTPKVCTVEGCEKRAHGHGLCDRHRYRLKARGEVGPADLLPRRTIEVCTVEGCERVHFGLGFCAMHYRRVKVKGDPGPAEPLKRRFKDLAGLRFGTLVIIRRVENDASGAVRVEVRCDCGATRIVLFSTITSDTATCRDYAAHHRREVVGYGAIHRRLRVDRGPAKDHRCVGCGAQADDWSYEGGDPAELIGKVHGKSLPYSLDLSRYSPRCRTCHKHFDDLRERAS